MTNEAYEKGDYETALIEITPRAEQGDVEAQRTLGQMYQNGYGVPQDDKQAAQWFRLAAEQGHAGAQYNLGWMYQKGKGVSWDYQKAAQWYRRAAKQGHAEAQYDLGLLYANGEGVPKDYVSAYMWLNIAASAGHYRATHFRDDFEEEMSKADIITAQKRATKCVESDYKDC